MALPKVIISDDASIECSSISIKSIAYPIPLTAVVRAAITTLDGKQRMTDVVTIDNTDTGNDWANSLVVVAIPKASWNTDVTESDAVINAVAGNAKIQLEINDDTRPVGQQVNTWEEVITVGNSVIN